MRVGYTCTSRYRDDLALRLLAGTAITANPTREDLRAVDQGAPNLGVIEPEAAAFRLLALRAPTYVPIGEVLYAGDGGRARHARRPCDQDDRPGLQRVDACR